MRVSPFRRVALITGSGQKVANPCANTRISRPTIMNTHTASAPPVSQTSG
jgi:hypothetical protein